MSIFASTIRKELSDVKAQIGEKDSHIAALQAELKDLKSKTTDVAEISATYHLEKEKWDKEITELINGHTNTVETLKALHTTNVESLTKEFQAKSDDLTSKIMGLTADIDILKIKLSEKHEVEKSTVNEMVNKQVALKMSALGVPEDNVPADVVKEENTTQILDQASKLEGFELANFLKDNMKAVGEALKARQNRK